VDTMQNRDPYLPVWNKMNNVAGYFLYFHCVTLSHSIVSKTLYQNEVTQGSESVDQSRF